MSVPFLFEILARFWPLTLQCYSGAIVVRKRDRLSAAADWKQNDHQTPC